MNIDIPVHRFKYSGTMITLLSNFAGVHRNDDRKDFRKFWDEFVENNLGVFEREVTIMKSRGFIGDPYNAIYKSTRFYYRKIYDDSGKKKNTKKHPYSKFPSELLKLIDIVIEKYISMNLEQVTDNEYICNITPASCYTDFCDEYENDLFIHIGNYVRQTHSIGGDVSSSRISNKLKKTFKNRFYKIQEKIRQIKR
jgi:hypothetical protein